MTTAQRCQSEKKHTKQHSKKAGRIRWNNKPPLMLITNDKNGISTTLVYCMRVQNIWINKFPLRKGERKKNQHATSKRKQKKKTEDNKNMTKKTNSDSWEIYRRFIFVYDLHLLFFGEFKIENKNAKKSLYSMSSFFFLRRFNWEISQNPLKQFD